MTRSDAIVFCNGPVRTWGVRAPAADWVRVEGGRVRALGRGAPPEDGTPRFDLAGRTLVPAFCDAHVHLTWIATSLLGADLESCASADEVIETLRGWEGPGRGARGEWIVGHGFDESSWRDKRLPLRRELDAVQSQRPVLLQRVCGHVGVVNSAALRGIAPGPHTDVETGRLAEDDLYAVNDALRPSSTDLAAVLPRVSAVLHAHGITAVHDVTPPEMLQALAQARQAGSLEVRVSCSVPARYVADAGAGLGMRGEPALDLAGLARLRARTADDPFLRVLGLKIFTDGSLGARTAFLRQPYDDAPDTRGRPLYALDELRDLARRAHAAGLQLMAHAIGDAALDLALDALQPILSAGNPLRHRIEHAEVTPADLVERLAGSGVRVCVQPNFAARWSGPGGMNGQRLGARLEHCNVYRTLAQAGVPLAFGSDCMPLGAAFGLQGAVMHPVEAQRLDPAAALRLYTSAAAELAGGTHGHIAPGSPADLVVLRSDPEKEAARGRLGIEAVFVAGRRHPIPPGGTS